MTHTQGNPIPADFSAESFQAKMKWHDMTYLKCWEGKCTNWDTHPARLLLRIEGEIRNFSDKKESSRNPHGCYPVGSWDKQLSDYSPLWNGALWHLYCEPECLCLWTQTGPGTGSRQDKTKSHDHRAATHWQHWCRQFWEALENFPLSLTYDPPAPFILPP